jgi:hypothetical protein
MSVEMMLAFIMISCFCICSALFLRALMKPKSLVNLTGYSQTALRLQRAYSIFAWAVMSLAFLAGVVISFYQVYVLL